MTLNMQKGFISLSLTGYIALGLGSIILIMGMLLKFQSSRIESCQKEHAEFVARVEALGLEAQKQKLAQEARDKLNKQKADNELKKLRSANADLSKRMRSDTNRSFLSREASPAGKPETACFKPDELDRAIQSFASRTAELIELGQNAVTDLQVSRDWANQ